VEGLGGCRGLFLFSARCSGQRRLRIPTRRFYSLGYVVCYSRDNESEARQAKVLTPDEARRIAVNIARLPELLGKGERD
jgi:hypothetical protein